MVLFVVALPEFLLVPARGTSVFLIITALSLIDVIAGFAVSRAARHRHQLKAGYCGSGTGTGRPLSSTGRRTVGRATTAQQPAAEPPLGVAARPPDHGGGDRRARLPRHLARAQLHRTLSRPHLFPG